MKKNLKINLTNCIKAKNAIHQGIAFFDFLLPNGKMNSHKIKEISTNKKILLKLIFFFPLTTAT